MYVEVPIIVLTIEKIFKSITKRSLRELALKERE
jgi:hypothetical protein